MRTYMAARGVSAQTADLVRRSAIEPDTLAPGPAHTPSGGYHLVDRSKGTGTEDLLRDEGGERFQFAGAAQALEARNALHEQAAVKLGKPNEWPGKHNPGIRNTCHMAQEMPGESKLAGVEPRDPDGERRELEMSTPSNRALDLADLAGRWPYTLRVVPVEPGDYNLTLVDASGTVTPEVLTDARGQALRYESAEAAEKDVGRLLQQIEAREETIERGRRSR